MKKLFDLRRVGNKPVDIVGGMTFDWQQSAYKGKFIWGGGYDNNGLYFNGNQNLISTNISNLLKYSTFKNFTVILTFRHEKLRYKEQQFLNFTSDGNPWNSDHGFRVRIYYINTSTSFHPSFEYWKDKRLDLEESTSGIKGMNFLTEIYDKTVYEFQYSNKMLLYFNGNNINKTGKTYTCTHTNFSDLSVLKIGGFVGGGFNLCCNGWLYNLRIYDGLYHHANYNKEVPFYQNQYCNLKFK